MDVTGNRSPVDIGCEPTGNSAVSMARKPNLTPSRRNTNLDALRALAIFMVLFRHAGMAISLLHASTPYTLYGERIGWAGVDLFFVLSGFLISGLLFADFQEHGRISVGRFYIRRGFKIWPALYALIFSGLLISAVMPGHHLPARGILPELFFMQDYFPSIWGLTWSIAVEEHFYLCLPLLFLLLLRRDRGRPFAALPAIFAAIAIFCLVCRFAVGWKQNGVVDDWTAIFPTHLRMDGLMFGVLICYFNRFRSGVFQWMVQWWGGWVVVALALVALSIFPLENREMHTWGFTVLYLAAGFLVAKAVAHEGPKIVRIASRWLARIGVYSYSIYIWHMFFVWLVLPHFHIKSPILTYWGSIIGPIPFGIVMAKIIEIPVLRFRDRVFPTVLKESPARVPGEEARDSVAIT
jgi:peptidoglycan/LPS O-acetylase OafA/YrhL